MRIVLSLMLIASVALADTTVYKRARPDGTVEYSDEPLPGGEEVSLPELPTYEPAPLPRPLPRTASPSPAPAPVYEQIRVTEPPDEATLFYDEAGIAVAVTVEPGLKPGHRIQLFLDGRPAATGSGGSFRLSGVERGSHAVTAAVTDERGRTLLRSPPVTFHLRQHSLLRPGG